MADIIDINTRIEFPAQPTPCMSREDIDALLTRAIGGMHKPVAGCLLILWDADGIMAVSDNRAQMYTNEQLTWLAYGAAHLKGRGVIQPVAQGGAFPSGIA